MHRAWIPFKIMKKKLLNLAVTIHNSQKPFDDDDDDTFIKVSKL